MKYNEIEFFEFEKNTSLLLNSVIDYLFIELRGHMSIVKIDFTFPQQKRYKKLSLELKDLDIVSINQTKESYGQQIHNYKFLHFKEKYYLSLDPDESSIELTEDDQDYFLFKKLSAFVFYEA